MAEEEREDKAGAEGRKGETVNVWANWGEVGTRWWFMAKEKNQKILSFYKFHLQNCTLCTFHIVIDICCSSDEEISASFDGDDNCEEELEYSDDYEQVGKWVRWMSVVKLHLGDTAN